MNRALNKGPYGPCYRIIWFAVPAGWDGVGVFHHMVVFPQVMFLN